jgi:hypothetical protein
VKFNKEKIMKCICGYEHKSGIDENGCWSKHLIGDEEFIDLCVFAAIVTDNEPINIAACPKCKTVKIANKYESY